LYYNYCSGLHNTYLENIGDNDMVVIPKVNKEVFDNGVNV